MGSCTSYFRVGKFLINSDRRSSYLLKLGPVFRYPLFIFFIYLFFQDEDSHNGQIQEEEMSEIHVIQDLAVDEQ